MGLAQGSKKLHHKAVLADTHNDVLSSGVLDGIDISNRVKEGHTDLPRLKEGGVDIQFFSVWTGDKPRTQSFFQDALQEIDSLNKLLLKNPAKISLALRSREVKKALQQEKLVALIGVEGGHMIEGDLAKLEELADKGMRYLTLTWNNSTHWASSAMDETLRPDSLKQWGLSGFGRSVVKKLNELGVIVDLSHVGEKTFYDAIETSVKPVMLSHSSVWSLCPVFRNVKDEQIRAVARNGGVICINFYSGFISRKWDAKQQQLDRERASFMYERSHLDSAQRIKEWRAYRSQQLDPLRPTIGELVDHIDYIVRIAGDRYVGIGSDFDGVSSLPVGLEDVTTYPKITEELVRRGYSKRSIKRILGGNVMRVMKANF
jgi:membrane dipeptidase